ncbi:hypothetical protein ACIPM0_03595 [Pseudomonas sichuanensis]|uniref:hypothetical protein n=1 Tax=Pseudomonas sichuanensis TaxID=2213015 RepID=UPI0038206BA6
MDHDNQQAIDALAKGLITLHAPEEIDYFEQLKQQSNEVIQDDDAFAFGVAEVVPAITPIALMIAKTAVNFLLETMGEVGTDIMKEKYKSWARGLFSASPKIAPTLTEVQKEALTKALLAAALRSGVKTDLAVKLSSKFIDNVL